MLGIDKFQLGIEIAGRVTPNQNAERQFIETFFRRIQLFANNPDDINRAAEEYSSPEAVYIFSALRDLEPIIFQQFPALIPKLSEAKAQANALMSEENQNKLKERDKFNESMGMSFEERIKLIKKADGEGKLTDKMIVDLVTWSAKSEEQFAAVEKWIDKIQDEKIRPEVGGYFNFMRSKLAIKEKRFAEARKYADKIPELEHRASLYFELAAEQNKTVSDAAQVFETLNEVDKIARAAENSVAKAQVMLGLAVAYEKVNHSVALDELSEAIRVINQLENPDLLSTSVYRQIIGKGFATVAVYTTAGFSLETAFEEIGKKDFELALGNAKAINDKYYRTLAVLAIAKNCVKNAAKTNVKK